MAFYKDACTEQHSDVSLLVAGALNTAETCPLWRCAVRVFSSTLSTFSSPPINLLAASGRVRGQRGHQLLSLSSPLAHRHVPCVFEWSCWLRSNSGKPLVLHNRERGLPATSLLRSRFSPSSSSSPPPPLIKATLPTLDLI